MLRSDPDSRAASISALCLFPAIMLGMLPPARNHENPYETPRIPQADQTVHEDERTLSATFSIDRKLLQRAVHFDVERRPWFRRSIFFASVITMAALTFLLIFRQPFPWALSMVLAFVLLHMLQIVLPYWWTRNAIRKFEELGRWPLTFGENRVRLSTNSLEVVAGERTGHWSLEQIADAFYLGDTLLICPEPGIIVPIPRTADFGSDSFQTFCRVFVLRMRGTREQEPS